MLLLGSVGLPTAVLGAVITALVLRTLVRRYLRYLEFRHIPGPPTTGWSRLWLLRQALRGEQHKVFYELNKKYGMTT